MPELPEVQTTVSGLNKYVKNKRIKNVWSDFHIKTSHGYKNNVKNKKYFDDLRKRILGAEITEAERIGKNVIINLSNNESLVVHMKMTGHFLYGKYKKEGGAIWKAQTKEELQDPFNQFIHFVIEFSDGYHLAFSDMRKFASICISPTQELKNCASIKDLGVDALVINPKEFITQIRKVAQKRKNLPIKTLLMDQSFVSGIGNIYSDEALFVAGIHPLSSPNKISDKKLNTLLTETKKILKKSIKLGGDSMSDYRNILGERGGFQNCHKAYRKTGERCQKVGCRGIIQRKVIKTRSAHFCNKHQYLYQ
jgi:formamidopyrimidine-DNA glycosylase